MLHQTPVPLRLLVIALALALAVAAAPPAKLCFVVRPTDDVTAMLFTARFAVDYYRTAFSAFNWSLAAISNGNFNPTARDAVQAFVKKGDDCAAIMGPGSSTYSVALSPVVSVPWVGIVSSATELSDLTAHPWFSRVIMTDAQIGAGVADTLAFFGWRHAHIICSDDVYGNSLSQQLTASLIQRNGGVGISQSLLPTSDVAAVNAYFDLIELGGSTTRVVTVAVGNSNALYASILNVTLSRGLHQKYVFVFSETACSGDVRWRALKGALCLTIRLNKPMFASFGAAYATRDITGDVAIAKVHGRTPSLASLTLQSVATALAHDAVYAILTSLNAHNNLSDPVGAVRVMRSSTLFDGLTGAVSMDAQGNRAGALLNVVNVNDEGVEVVVGAIAKHGLFVREVNDTTGQPTVPYWLASYYSDSPPPDLVAAPFRLAGWIIALATGCVVLLLACVLSGMLARKNKETVLKLMSMGLIRHARNALLALAVLVIKILVAVNFYFTDVELGYLIPYYIVVAFGSVSSSIGIFLRVRFIVVAVVSEEPIPVDDELAYDLAVRRAIVANAIMSDLPSLIVSCVVLNAHGKSTVHEGLLLAMIVVTSLFIGTKASVVWELLDSVLASKDADDADAVGAQELSKVATLDAFDSVRSHGGSEAAAQPTPGPTDGGPMPHPAPGTWRAKVVAVVRLNAEGSQQSHERATLVTLGRRTAIEWRKSHVSVSGVARLVLPEIMRCFNISIDTFRLAFDDAFDRSASRSGFGGARSMPVAPLRRELDTAEGDLAASPGVPAVPRSLSSGMNSNQIEAEGAAVVEQPVDRRPIDQVEVAC